MKGRRGVNMPEKKPKTTVAESPIADVFDGRHPSASEKEWGEKTLAPALDKNPEKSIGEPTGVNLDDHGNARYTTVSGVPIRRLYTQADLPEDWSYDQYLGYPGQAAFTPRGIAASCSPCGSSRASPHPRKPTAATSICSTTAAADCRLRSTCPR